MVSKLPRKNVKSWKAGNSGFARPLGGLDCFVELVAVKCVGIPMLISLMPGVLKWRLG